MGPIPERFRQRPASMAGYAALLVVFAAVTLAYPGAWAGPRTLDSTDSIRSVTAEGFLVWAATTKGILCLNTVDQTWVRYTVEDGLPSDNITAVAVDQEGNRWVGTPSGAAVFDGKGWTVYNGASGLLDDEVRAISVDKSGTVWLVTARGMAGFDGRTWSRFPVEELGRLTGPERSGLRLFSFKAREPAPDLPSPDRKSEDGVSVAEPGEPTMPTVATEPPKPVSSSPLSSETAPSPDGAVTADYPYTVCIGSYPTRDQAFSVAARFMKKGDETFTGSGRSRSGDPEFLVYMGNFTSREEAAKKVRELKRRRFRMAEIVRAGYGVQVEDCGSFIATEEARQRLEARGIMAYTIHCSDAGYGRSRVLAGIYETGEQARKAAEELRQVFPGAAAALR